MYANGGEAYLRWYPITEHHLSKTRPRKPATKAGFYYGSGTKRAANDDSNAWTGMNGTGSIAREGTNGRQMTTHSNLVALLPLPKQRTAAQLPELPPTHPTAEWPAIRYLLRGQTLEEGEVPQGRVPD